MNEGTLWVCGAPLALFLAVGPATAAPPRTALPHGMAMPAAGGIGGMTQRPGPQPTGTAYLQGDGQRPIAHSLYPSLATAPGRAFQKTCETCHALPSPKQHTAAEWPAVVARMTYDMRWMGVRPPSEYQLKEVLRYLEQHAAGAPGGAAPGAR